ncbi:outer membrane biogenesis protein BamB [Maioricimonas rarisocia]|uniref:Outer membrane biogenesis protein BamB n=1 Tax=Maioricimonas rarisocia TaxID=2528026 RepID=A0A517Z7E3_9PLAN|nr:PQQ-binding-like beta-propeller repeat protein [Maioricimonas rarisocia]QDU38369.1 outer membrane biogenesis protein BamB [Maioricimonas rarisocia]
MRTLILHAAFIQLVALPVSAGDWNQWRGSGRDGLAETSPPLIETLPPEGLVPVWKSEPIKSARSGGWGSPSVAGSRVYLFTHEKEQQFDPGKKKFPWLSPDKRVGMTDEEYAEYERNRRDEDEARAKAFAFRERVYCFDAETGETKWISRSESVYTRFPQSGSPTVIDGRIYILGAGRQARCLDASNGNDVWTTRIPGEFRDEFYQSSILVVEGVAVVAATNLFGLNAKTGEIVWQVDEQKSRTTHSSPVSWNSGDGEYVIINFAGGQTACVDPHDGAELWRVKSEGGLSTPVVVGDRLITYGNSRQKGVRCFALNKQEPELVWHFRGVQDKGSSPVVVDGHLYVQGEKRVACIDIETGDREWTDFLDLASPQYTSLIAADGKVFYAHDGLTCFRATPDGFESLIEAKFDAEGRVATEEYFRDVLNLDEIEKEENGLEKSTRLYQKHVGRHGPLRCATPAISNGRMYVRTNDALVCYDLRASQ